MATNPRNTNGHRRRTTRARVLAAGGPCALCGAPVDTTLPHGTPASPEVDEIIPISKGGSPVDRDNTRLVHRLCNQRRGNRMDVAGVPQPTRPPIIGAQRW